MTTNSNQPNKTKKYLRGPTQTAELKTYVNPEQKQRKQKVDHKVQAFKQTTKTLWRGQNQVLYLKEMTQQLLFWHSF